MPRSIVRFLEEELRKNQDPSLGYEKSDGMNHDLIEKVLDGLTPTFLGLTSAIPLARCAVAGTKLPSTTFLGANDSNDIQTQTALASSHHSTSGLSTIPKTVADFLFSNYMTRVVTQCPLFYSADLEAYFDSVFRKSTTMLDVDILSGSPRERFIIGLIMAISLTTAARTQQVWANSIATGLVKEAMQNIQAVCTNDIHGLQALLLFLQYANLDPTTANVWLLSGFTTQACIDLGLHRETPAIRELDPLTRDVRRRVFWCAYEMEIATSAALLRPSSLLKLSIDVPFPAEVDDGLISSYEIDLSGYPVKFASRRIWQFRQIEAEVLLVQFHNGSIPSQYSTLDEWMDGIVNRIDGWKQEINWASSLNTDPSKLSQWEEMCLYSNIARDVIIVMLFRPSPRVKDPSSERLMQAFPACIGVADGYWKQANLSFGNSKFVFHPCYHTFSAGILFLRTLQRCKDAISENYSLSEVENFISCFSRLFTTIAERWPAASRCLEEFERLMIPVKREYVDYTVQKARNALQDSSYHQIPTFVTGEDLAFGSAWQLDNISFGPLLTTGIWDCESPELALSVPLDWDAEFNFGMN